MARVDEATAQWVRLQGRAVPVPGHWHEAVGALVVHHTELLVCSVTGTVQASVDSGWAS